MLDTSVFLLGEAREFDSFINKKVLKALTGLIFFRFL